MNWMRISLLVLLFGFITACSNSDSDNTDAPFTVQLTEIPDDAREGSWIVARLNTSASNSAMTNVDWFFDDKPADDVNKLSDGVYEVLVTRVNSTRDVTVTVTVSNSQGMTASDSANLLVIYNHPPELSGVIGIMSVPALDSVSLNPQVSDRDGDSVTATVTKIEGPAQLVSPVDSLAITIATPKDSGQNQLSVFEIVVTDSIDTVTERFEIFTPTSAPRVVTYHSGFTEEGDDSHLDSIEISSLTVTALSIDQTGNYRYQDQAFALQLSSEDGAELAEIYSITLNNGHATYDVKPFFEYDIDSGLLSVAVEDITSFSKHLSKDSALHEIHITALDSYGAYFAPVVTFRNGFARINGQLVDHSGAPYPGLQGETVSVYGALTGLTYLAEVDSGGRFTAGQLPGDTYNLSLLTDSLEIVSDSVLVTGQADQYDRSPLVIRLGDEASVPEQSVEQSKTPRQVSDNPERQAAHDRIRSANVQLNSQYSDAQTIGSVKAVAGLQDMAVIDVASISIPEGIETITIRTTVFTNEYPVYTTVNSQYNDSWQYSYSIGSSTARNRQGNVNTTHASQGTIETNETVDVTGMAGDSIHLYARSTNIGDSALPTIVTVNAYADVQQLSIGGFMHSDGLGNDTNASANWFIGIGETSHRKWNAIVDYTPLDASLDSAECTFTAGSTHYPIQHTAVKTIGKGKARVEMGFLNNSSLPSSDDHGNVGCTFRASDDEGLVYESTVPTIMNLASGRTSITPFTRYNDSSRRFGKRDIGGDDWMTSALKAYVRSHSLPYNDASREHGGCFFNDDHYSTRYNYPGFSCDPQYRDHAGHQDGKQIDLIYAIPALSTQSIVALSSTAHSNPEDAARLAQWVTTARSNIQTAAENSEVKDIYINHRGSLIWSLIVKGADKNGSQIPTLDVWDYNSIKIRAVPSHISHFHVTII